MITLPRFRITAKTRDDSQESHCVHCGRSISWLYEMTDSETGETMYPLGGGCILTLTGITVTGHARAWAEYNAEMEEDERARLHAARCREWQLVNAEVLAGMESLANGTDHYLPIAEDMLNKVSQYGTLTEKQAGLVNNLLAKRDNYVSKQEFENTHWRVLVLYHCRLGKYDSECVNDMSNKSETWGLTHGQNAAINKVYAKYSRQIGELVEKDELVKKIINERIIQ